MSFSQADVSLVELERAASDVIEILKTIPELASLRVAVFGGLALWKHIPAGRTTKDVDFIINLDSAPNSVKGKLLSLHGNVFEERAQYFYYKAPSGTFIQIDMCASWQPPYLPEAAKVVNTIAKGVVPYISKVDLITFKIRSCGYRTDKVKARRDAVDARTLLEQETKAGPLPLTAAQKKEVVDGLPDIVKLSDKNNESWWKERLGL